MPENHSDLIEIPADWPEYYRECTHCIVGRRWIKRQARQGSAIQAVLVCDNCTSVSGVGIEGPNPILASDEDGRPKFFLYGDPPYRPDPEVLGPDHEEMLARHREILSTFEREGLPYLLTVADFPIFLPDRVWPEIELRRGYALGGAHEPLGQLKATFSDGWVGSSTYAMTVENRAPSTWWPRPDGPHHRSMYLRQAYTDMPGEASKAVLARIMNYEFTAALPPGEAVTELDTGEELRWTYYRLDDPFDMLFAHAVLDPTQIMVNAVGPIASSPDDVLGGFVRLTEGSALVERLNREMGETEERFFGRKKQKR